MKKHVKNNFKHKKYQPYCSPSSNNTLLYKEDGVRSQNISLIHLKNEFQSTILKKSSAYYYYYFS